MEKEFIPYEQSLALKELGFDKPCIKEYHLEELLNNSTDGEIKNSDLMELYGNSVISAPTFSQAFRFFREKYSLVHEISWSKYKGGLNFDYDVFSLVLPTDDELGDEDDIASDKSMETYDSLVDKGFRHHESNTYEEAEHACLIKLIEIVKKK